MIDLCGGDTFWETAYYGEAGAGATDKISNTTGVKKSVKLSW